MLQSPQVSTDLFGLIGLFDNYKLRTTNDLSDVNKKFAIQAAENNNRLLGYVNNETVHEDETHNETATATTVEAVDKDLNGEVALKKATNHHGLCRVCMDKSTGYHYGILSCEGCKVRVHFMDSFIY